MQSPPLQRRVAWTAVTAVMVLLSAGSLAAATATAVSSPDTLDSLAPQITLVAPAGGETLTVARAETLRWQIVESSWPAAASISVAVVDSATTLLTDQVSAAPSGQYAYVWTVPNSPTTSARLIVQATDRFGWAAADTGGTFTIQTDMTDVPALAVDRLEPAYPNPFNPSTTLAFTLAAPADVRLAVYDLLGHEVARLVGDHRQPGYHRVVWDGRTDDGQRVPSGSYLARLVVAGADRQTVQVTRLTLVK